MNGLPRLGIGKRLVLGRGGIALRCRFFRREKTLDLEVGFNVTFFCVRR